MQRRNKTRTRSATYTFMLRFLRQSSVHSLTLFCPLAATLSLSRCLAALSAPPYVTCRSAYPFAAAARLALRSGDPLQLSTRVRAVRFTKPDSPRSPPRDRTFVLLLLRSRVFYRDCVCVCSRVWFRFVAQRCLFVICVRLRVYRRRELFV